MDSWIADCFVWHAWFALSVPFRGKFLARGSWTFELVQLCLNTWIAECFVRHVWYALKNIYDQSDGFVRHAWFALSVFSRDGNFLLEAVGILSLSKYAWTVGFRLFR